MMQRLRVQAWRCVLGTLAVLALVGATSHAQAQGSVLRVNLGADLRVFDPLVTTNGITRRAAWLNYDFLYSLDANNVPQPQMVEKYTTGAGGLTHTFVLRPGLKFHDGSPVTAEDVVASLNRWENRDDLGKSIKAMTTSMKAVDARTFEIVLNKKYAKLPEAFGKLAPFLPVIVPKRLAQTDPTKAMPETIGSGPYRFVPEKFVPGSVVVYEKFKDYIPRPEAPSMLAGGKVANFDRVEVLNITDQQTAMAALQNGEVDVLLNPQFDFLPILRANPAVKVEITDKLGRLGFIRMNWTQPPFNDVRARRAVQWLVKQTDFLQAVAADPANYATCGALFVCNSLYGSEDNSEAVTGFDLNKAKQLLREAGYKGERVVVLQLTDLASVKTAGLVLAQSLRAAGINLEIREMDLATYNRVVLSKAPPDQGGWNIYVNEAAAMMIGDPTFILNSAACDAAYYGWPCDKEYEALREQFSNAANIDEARAIARKMQIRGSEIVLHVPYGVIYTPIAYRADLRGILSGPATEVFWNVRRVK